MMKIILSHFHSLAPLRNMKELATKLQIAAVRLLVAGYFMVEHQRRAKAKTLMGQKRH